MRQLFFEEQHQAFWRTFEQDLQQLEKRRGSLSAQKLLCLCRTTARFATIWRWPPTAAIPAALLIICNICANARTSFCMWDSRYRCGYVVAIS